MILTAALALAVGACGTAPLERRSTFAVEGLPRVDVTILAAPGHARDGDRYEQAAFTTLKVLGTWLAPFPDATVSVTADPTPWWSAPAAMAPEYAVARPLSRTYWERVVDTRELPAWFVDGLVEYSARRAVSRIVDERYLAVYRSRAEMRFFGGFVPYALRVQFRVEDEGDPVDAYRIDPRAASGKPLAAKVLLTLGTLERWIGRPVFDAILAEFASTPSGTRPTLDDFARLASRVSGQDLSWLFNGTLKSTGIFDYGIEGIDTRPAPDGAFRTTVDVGRFGDAVFSGATDDAASPFEHGRGITVQTTFEDGSVVRDTWDGRARQKTFEYRSRSRARSAEVDPDRVLLLDLDRSNNGATLDPGPARTAATRWAARWMVWLEDALLTYGSLT